MTPYPGAAAAALPHTPDFFPIGVWEESVVETANTAQDRAAGLNTYVGLTGDSSLDLVRQAGMYAIASADLTGPRAGFLLADEADMWGGPGSGPWQPSDGAQCPTTKRCGYTVLDKRAAQAADPALLRYANFGKGVEFWETDQEAARFVNGPPTLLSADTYWFTDPDICGFSEGGTLLDRAHPKDLSSADCRAAVNYGRTVDRLRALVTAPGGKPVWGFVEVGDPFEGSDRTITGAQIRAAVWSEIIHGARGVIYFNHSFGGSCQTQHVLRERCAIDTRSAVTDLNRQLTRLAPVLNAPSVVGALTVSTGIDTSLRLSGGTLYLLAASTVATGGHASFRLACDGGSSSGSATVLDENRSLPIRDGQFDDDFADGNAVHLYRLDSVGSCGLS